MLVEIIADGPAIPPIARVRSKLHETRNGLPGAPLRNPSEAPIPHPISEWDASVLAIDIAFTVPAVVRNQVLRKVPSLQLKARRPYVGRLLPASKPTPNVWRPSPSGAQMALALCVAVARLALAPPSKEDVDLHSRPIAGVDIDFAAANAFQRQFIARTKL